MVEEISTVCKACGSAASGSVCNNCGHTFSPARLTIKGFLHEVFHLFTHLDRGFLFTFKKLLLEPGRMQREYVEGERLKHQKPFSMFFICATVAALIIYWINQALLNYYNAGDLKEGAFFNKYWVVLQMCLFPFYALITYLLFKKAKYNYAEICVMLLYHFSFIFIVLTVIQLTRLIWPDIETRYIELPVFIIYSAIANIHFFNKLPLFSIIFRSILSIGLSFLLASYIQDLLIRLFV